MRPRLPDRKKHVDFDSEDAELEEKSEEIQQVHLCTSADRRRVGAGGEETIVLSPEELCKVIILQLSLKDQSVTAQAGFPLTTDKEELVNSKDVQLGKPTARYLHEATKRADGEPLASDHGL